MELSILISFLSGILGAFIGTYCGAYFTIRRQETRIEEIRDVAIRMLRLVLKYAKEQNCYNVIENEFNNSFTITEKRSVIVSLHKVGLPILGCVTRQFDIKFIKFDNVVIDKEEISNMISEYLAGHCDNLFYLDADEYFNEGLRIKALRNIAKRWVKDTFMKSTCLNGRNIEYPSDWLMHYTWTEQNVLLAFKSKVSVNLYFENNGMAKIEEMSKLIDEVDNGLWDVALLTDPENYLNMKSTSEMNSLVMNLIVGQQK